MKKCRYCKTEIDHKAKICPHCKKKQTNPLVKGSIIFFIVLMVIVGISSGMDEDQIQQEQREKYSFVEEAKIIEEGNEYFKTKYITGAIKNTTDKKTSYIQIVFNLFDEDGNVIGSAMDNINHIDPDGVWRFKAIILEDDFDTFKFESITGF